MTNDCTISGLADFVNEDDVEGTMHFIGTTRHAPESFSNGEEIGTAPREEWNIVRLIGGKHDGQVHTLPVTCDQWSCGWCGATYA